MNGFVQNLAHLDNVQLVYNEKRAMVMYLVQKIHAYSLKNVNIANVTDS